MIHAHNLGAGEVRQILDVGYISEAALDVGVGRGRRDEGTRAMPNDTVGSALTRAV
jgi:hypothetical protein